MRALRLALGLAFALAGCTPDGLATDPRATLDPGSSGSTGFTTGHTGGSLSSATVGSSSGGAATSSGSIGGTSAGSSGGSGSGGTTGNCPQTGPAPTLQCQRSDGSTRWLMTKESVHLDCTLTGAEETPTWSGSVAPGFFSVDVRNAPAVITVGLGEATLPTTFGDTQVQVTLTATPQLRELKDNFGNVHRLGVLGITRSMHPGDVKTQKFGPASAVAEGAKETWFIVDRTLSHIGGVFAGRESADQLGGPIRIAQVSGEVATVGFVALMHLTAVLSVSIGLLNLFPIPLLDGGHLLFYGIEAARGRPLSERSQEIGFRIGLAIVVMLMIFATFNDILRLATS